MPDDGVKYYPTRLERYESVLRELLTYDIGEQNKEIILEALDCNDLIRNRGIEMKETIKRVQAIQRKINEGWEFSRGLLPDHLGDGDFTPVLNADNSKRGMRKTINSQDELDEFLSK